MWARSSRLGQCDSWTDHTTRAFPCGYNSMIDIIQIITTPGREVLSPTKPYTLCVIAFLKRMIIAAKLVRRFGNKSPNAISFQVSCAELLTYKHKQAASQVQDYGHCSTGHTNVRRSRLLKGDFTTTHGQRKIIVNKILPFRSFLYTYKHTHSSWQSRVWHCRWSMITIRWGMLVDLIKIVDPNETKIPTS